MSLNSNTLGVQNEYSIYLPTNYLNYKYAITTNADYLDLVTSPVINQGSNYDYIRVFLDRPGFVIERSITNSTSTLRGTLVNVSDDFFARSDAFSICGCTLCLFILLIWVFNCITEFFNKGGLFHL